VVRDRVRGGAERREFRVTQVQSDRPGPRHRQRALVALALILGVVTMHAIVACVDDVQDVHRAQVDHRYASSPGSSDQAVAGDGHARTDVSTEPCGPAGSGPMPALEHLSHLCVAILTGAVVLALAALGLLLLLGPGYGPDLVGPKPRHGPSRPPPPTAVRLAQLCVLRS
jgi:hypothetical protein